MTTTETDWAETLAWRIVQGGEKDRRQLMDRWTESADLIARKTAAKVDEDSSEDEESEPDEVELPETDELPEVTPPSEESADEHRQTTTVRGIHEESPAATTTQRNGNAESPRPAAG